MYGPQTNSCLTSKNTSYLFCFQDPNKLSTTEALPVTVEHNSATQICMCSLDNISHYYCDILNISKEVFPGATLSFAMATLHNGELVPRVITANLQNDPLLDSISSSVLIGDLQMTQRSCTQLNYTLLSYRSTEIITVTLVDNTVLHPLNVLAHILSYPLGFSIQSTSPACDCIPQLAQLGVTCNIQDQTFGHTGNVWIGMYNDSSSNNFDAFYTLIYSSSCPYCNLGYNVRMVIED